MIPTDNGPTTVVAWMPVLLTLATLLVGLVFVVLAENILRHVRPEREIALRIGWWFIGAGCGMGGLFVWWMVT